MTLMVVMMLLLLRDRRSGKGRQVSINSIIIIKEM